MVPRPSKKEKENSWRFYIGILAAATVGPSHWEYPCVW
jgi:hypothetical protein